jgi:hypothetical protein
MTGAAIAASWSGPRNEIHGQRLDNANTFVPKERTGFHAYEFLMGQTRYRCACSNSSNVMSSSRPSLNPVERLLEIAVVTVTLGVTAYLIGWALWLW